MRDMSRTNLVDELLSRADHYCARSKLSRARIATLAVNDGDFFRRVEAGGTLTIKTYEKFMAWLDEAGQRLDEQGDKEGRTSAVSGPLGAGAAE